MTIVSRRRPNREYTDSLAAGVRYSGRVKDIPPLRAEPWTEDGGDGARCDYVLSAYHSQDNMLRQRDRMVEKNLRLLMGQHWISWSNARQRFVDLSEYYRDDEKRWRHLPVLNRLFLWFMLTKARCTENPPRIVFQPGPDRVDAELAEVLEPLYAYLWSQLDMLERIDLAASWLIPSGSVYFKTRLDPNKGDDLEYKAPALLQLLDQFGQPVPGQDGAPIQRLVPEAPYDEQGNALAKLVQGEPEEEGGEPDIGFELTGEPFRAKTGFPVVDVIPCLEVRGEWGPHAWHEKSWHCHRAFLTPEQFYNNYGYEVEPDVTGAMSDQTSTILKLLYGSGLFRAADNRPDSWLMEFGAAEFVSVYEFWHAPMNLPGMKQDQQSAGGRLLTVTGGRKVVRDGPRPLPFKHTSPIHEWGFVRVPGRPQATSPQEMLNGPNLTLDRLVGQVLEHATKVANPTMVYDANAIPDESQISSRPGGRIGVNMSGLTQPPVAYVAPPALGQDIYKSIQILTQHFDELGALEGAQGSAPTTDSSGELVKELRFNSDRFIGPTLRQAPQMFARMALDWKLFIPVIWDEPKILSITGEDNISRTITLLPEWFQTGEVNAVPDLESMLPESRQERQARWERLYDKGILGMQGAPDAIQAYLEGARFPHMSRLTRQGGVDRSMAEHNVGLLLKRKQIQEIPIFEWYDHAIHLAVLERFMKAPEYLKQDMEVQQQMVLFRELLMGAQQLAAQLKIERESAVQGAMLQSAATNEANAARTAAELGPPGGPPGAGPPGPGGAPAPETEAPVTPGPPGRGPTRSVPSGAAA